MGNARGGFQRGGYFSAKFCIRHQRPLFVVESSQSAIDLSPIVVVCLGATYINLVFLSVVSLRKHCGMKHDTAVKDTVKSMHDCCPKKAPAIVTDAAQRYYGVTYLTDDFFIPFLWPQNLYKYPPPCHKHSTIKSPIQIGPHFIIFHIALGLLLPFAVPHTYICRGAQRERTNPNNNTTPFPYMSPKM